MNSSEVDGKVQVEKRSGSRGVLCSKCEHLNPPGRNDCEKCSAHLFLVCRECGQGNERVRTRCTNCGHRLHRSLFGRVKRRMQGSYRLAALRVLLFMGAIFVAYLFISFVSNLRFRAP